MRRVIAVSGFTVMLAVAAASLIVVPNATSRAASDADGTFLIPASDGYGVADCLAGAHACGRVVADAWCEAHGFSRAETYGVAPAGTVTGSVQPQRTMAGSRPIAITCAN
jgi:hypothetical protein